MKEIFLDRGGEKTTRCRLAAVFSFPFLHPELRIAPPYNEWTFPGDFVRMPEFAAPAFGKQKQSRNYRCRYSGQREWCALQAGWAGSSGLTLFMQDGILCYEYNFFIIQRTKIRATDGR